MPVILQILMSLLGFGAGGLAGMGAKRFLAPAAGKAISKVLPGLAGKSLGKLGTVGKLGTGAAGLGGFIGGAGAFDVVTQAAMGNIAGEPPLDDSVDDVLARIGQGQPFAADQSRGLQRAFDESEIRNVLESLGVDFEEFSQLAGARRGLI